MRNRGLSLIEMLLTMFIVAMAMAAAARTFNAGLTFDQKSARARDAFNDRLRVEDTITRLIAGANLKGKDSYFLSPIPISDAGVEQQPFDSVLGAGSASLAFTSLAEAPPARMLTQTGGDLLTFNGRFGPIGGETEVGISTIAVGDPSGKRGLFLREQRPADAEPSRGGHESLLDEHLRDIRFEFWDGTTWQTSWDTKNTQKGKLPTVARITYILREEDTPRTFTVRLQIDGGGAASQ